MEPNLLHWAGINGRQELNRFEKRLAHVERNRQRVVMFPQGKRAADLANEPPHERRSLREVVPDVSCDSVHAKHDSLSTFSLRPQPLFRLLAI